MSSVDMPGPVIEDLSLLSETFLAEPEPILERALRDVPVFYMPEFGMWAVTRHADVSRVLADFETFSQNAATMIPPPRELADRVSTGLLTDGIAILDPPRHTVVRRAINTVFTRGHVRANESQIQDIAEHLIDGFIDRGRCDLLHEYFYELSQRSTIRLLGLPEDADILPRYQVWGDDIIALFTARPDPGEEPVQTVSDEELFTRWSRIAEASEFLLPICQQRRREPGEDMISDLTQLKEEDGSPALTDAQVLSLTMTLITGGTHATAISMARLLMLLHESPEQLAEARSDRAALENAIEEALRLKGPGIGLFRWTTRDVEIAGVTIPKNSRVMAMFCATGIDEAQYGCPMDFDIHRDNADTHLAFGRGRHFCPGAPLARAEIRLGMEVLFRRIPDLKIVPGQSFEYAPSIIAFMLKHLECEWSV